MRGGPMKSEQHLNDDMLQQYLDSALTAADRGRVEAHLATCARCRVELEALQQLFVALDELAPAPGHSLVPGVMAQLPPRRREKSFLLRAAFALQGVAAVALLAWGWRWLARYAAGLGSLLSFETLRRAGTAIAGWASGQWLAVAGEVEGQFQSLVGLPAATWHRVQSLVNQFSTLAPLRLSPLYLALLVALLVACWIAGNALLLRRAPLNGQQTVRR